MNNVEYLIIYTHRQQKTYKNPTGDWLGIHYLAAFLNENGFPTLSFAGAAHEVPSLLEKYANKKSLKAIGLSCDYENREEVIFFSRYIKEHWNLYVIVGGPQSFFLKEDFFLRSKADVVICGEGELTSLEVVATLWNGGELSETIRGIKFMSQGKLVTTAPRPLIENLDALPFPNPDYALGSLFRPTLASFLTGRGCPFSCSFCYEGGNTKKVRWRSVENVVEEVRTVLSSRPDIHYIMFTDDTFTVDRNRVLKFCSELKNLRKEFNFTWFCEGHVRTIYKDKELLQTMVDAGMSCLQIGIESGDNDVLRLYNKNITTEMIESVVKDAFEVGVNQLWGNIILGAVYETPERILQNIDFVKHLYEIAPGMINMDVVYFWPLPGTKITTNPELFGMTIKDIDSISSNMDFPVADFENMTIKELANARNRFMDSILQTARKLVLSIPTERAVDIVTGRNNHSNFSIWLRVLNEREYLYKFYYLLGVGATVMSSDVSEETLSETHPMRTGFPEYFAESGNLMIDGEEITAKETAVLCLSSGKLTLKALWNLIEKEYFSSYDDFFQTLISLETRRLLTFSKF